MPPEAIRATLQARRGELNATAETGISGGASFGPPFAGLQTATPGTPQPAITLEAPPGYYTYITQSGDTLPVLAVRFSTETEAIISPEPVSPDGYLPVGLPLGIPNTLEQPPYPSALLPDSEVVYSPTTVDFDIESYIQQANGFLHTYSETIDGVRYSGAAIVAKVAVETSTNPRLLLAFLEYRAGWVLGSRPLVRDTAYPLGFRVPGYKGFYRELVVLASQLNVGYYGWRQGSLASFEFKDGRTVPVHPALNAGSVAIQRLFAQFYPEEQWTEILYGPGGFPELHNQMFGDPWERAAQVEPLLFAGLAQPALELPFRPGERWSYTGGPHASWGTSTPYGAIDFSPVTGQPACEISRAWATAVADGVIARSLHGALALDLDGDGNEGTGWVIVYLHLAEQDRLPVGSVVTRDTPLGHPSCERGSATGTHIHLARKFNGEWLPPAGPAPYSLSGWLVVPGEKAYQGELVRTGEVVTANPGGPRTSTLVR